MISEKSFPGQLMRLLFVLLGGTLLSWLLTIVVLLFYTSFDIDAVARQSGLLLENTTLLRITQTIQSLCLFIIPPFIMSWINREKPASYLFFHKPTLNQVFLAMLSLVISVPLINILVTWNEGLHLPAFLNDVEQWMRISETTAAGLTERMLSGTSWMDLVISLFIVAILAGFGEEVFFRGLLQRFLSDAITGKKCQATGVYPKWVMHLSIWIIAFLFSAIHLQFFGFFPRLLLGAWFGYLLWWTGSIWVPVIAHMTNNAMSTFFVFAEKKGMLTGDPDQFGLNETWWSCLFSLFLLGVCIIYLRKKQEST